jgi:hypothetical protein
MRNIPPRTIVQFVHDILFLSVVRLKNGRPVLGLTSRPTGWSIPYTETVNGLPDSLKLVGAMPVGNREMQWVRGADNLIHLMSSADQNTFVVNFVNGASPACTLMAGSSLDAFFAIRPRDGRFVVQTVNAQREATRFKLLVHPYDPLLPGWQAGYAGFEECNVTAKGLPASAGIQNEISR